MADRSIDRSRNDTFWCLHTHLFPVDGRKSVWRDRAHARQMNVENVVSLKTLVETSVVEKKKSKKKRLLLALMAVRDQIHRTLSYCIAQLCCDLNLRLHPSPTRHPLDESILWIQRPGLFDVVVARQTKSPRTVHRRNALGCARPMLSSSTTIRGEFP